MKLTLTTWNINLVSVRLRIGLVAKRRDPRRTMQRLDPSA